MNQAEANDWLKLLPIVIEGKLRRCETDNERIEVIRDLLRNAGRDHMSVEDRQVCVEALQYLEAGDGIPG